MDIIVFVVGAILVITSVVIAIVLAMSRKASDSTPTVTEIIPTGTRKVVITQSGDESWLARIMVYKYPSYKDDGYSTGGYHLLGDSREWVSEKSFSGTTEESVSGRASDYIAELQMRAAQEKSWRESSYSYVVTL